MYCIYKPETIQKLIHMIHHMHIKTTWNENLFVGKLNHWYQWYLSEGVVPYAINSILYVTTLRGKYFKMYKN